MFDDRRRLEDRVYRLRTGYAWSQAPASRTVRLIGNVEVFATERDAIRMVRSNFLISEFWGDETRMLAGWCGHRFVQRDDRWEIVAKQVNLLECDQIASAIQASFLGNGQAHASPLPAGITTARAR